MAARPTVSCGRVIKGHSLAIVDTETFRELAPGAVGEIWLSGPSVASGYSGRPEETEATFRARLANAPQSGPWLRTGDLGTVVDGELYLLGRIKEMVIVGGRNHYAQDLEMAADAADPILGQDRTVAFSIDEAGEERFVLIHELTRATMRILEPDRSAVAIRRSVIDAHDIDVYAVIFVKLASLPRTTSGKLQRGKAQDLYYADGLKAVAEWHAAVGATVLHDEALAARLSHGAALPTRREVCEMAQTVPGIAETNAAFRRGGDGRVTIEVFVALEEPKVSAVISRAIEPRPMRFGLFFFGSDDPDADPAPRYDLLLSAAERADAAGLEAVWTPERHFSVFGGQYPSLVATSAAIAARTKRIGVRAGSVVLPLHHPVRVAEDWAVIDNLSAGRAGVSIASGWHPKDFVLAPGGQAGRKASMLDAIGTVRQLWRGEAVTLSNGAEEFEIQIRPLPVQAEIPMWLTAAGSRETFEEAGRLGINVLTFLAQTSPTALSEKIAGYRAAFAAAGHSGRPQVAAMVHTFLAPTADAARAAAVAPMRRYIAEATDLARTSGLGAPELAEASGALIDNAVAQFLDTRGLFGTPLDVLE